MPTWRRSRRRWACACASAGSRDLEISIDVRNPFELERALREERIDVAVGPFQASDPGLDQYPLHQERLSLYIGAGHALIDKRSIALQDLAGADCVMRGYLPQVMSYDVQFKAIALKNRRRTRATDALLELIQKWVPT